MGSRPGDPTPGTARKLFALCGNQCAFQSIDDRRGCETEVARPEWPRTQGEIAHIYGEAEGAARYDETVSVADRRAFENLVVLCPTHHHFIDYIEPDRYTVAVLMGMKATHEKRAELNWATEAELDRYVTLVLEVQFGVVLPTGRLDGGGVLEARGGVMAPGVDVPLRTGSVGAVDEVGVAGSQPPAVQRIEIEGIPRASAVGVATASTADPDGPAEEDPIHVLGTSDGGVPTTLSGAPLEISEPPDEPANRGTYTDTYSDTYGA
jgi:hypothetical protein